MNKPTDSVRIVIFDRHDPTHFLVLAEADDPENWKLTGGKFNTADESVEDAARREAGEELTLRPEEIGLRYVGPLKNDDGISARHIFAALADRTQPQPSDEIAALQWASEATVPESPNKEHILAAVALARTVLT